MNKYFTKYRELALSANVSNSKESLDWFRKRIRKDKTIAQHDSITEGFRRARIDLGEMVTYVYNPMLKEKLPYYDTHPLIVIMEIYRDGWLGLNVHYLPPVFRAKLFAEISYDKRRMIQIAEQLKKNPISYPAIKRYKADRLKTRPVAIPKEEWDIAIQLPFEKFVGASTKKIWANSRKQI